MTLLQLIELAAGYLQLDYIYDPAKITTDPITIRLHGKLSGRIKVKDLYKVLTAVLRFKGLVMTIDRSNLVFIVPASEALDVGAALIDPNTPSLGIGQTIATMVLEPRYTDATTIKTMLEALKVPIAISQVGGKLLITCYS